MRAFAKAASAGSTKREDGRTFSMGVLAAMLVCAAAFLGIGAPAASAAPEAKPGYPYLTTFGSGELAGPCCSRVRSPVAVDDEGNIYVVSENSERVLIFAPDALLGGTRLSEIAMSSNLPTDVAVDPTTTAVYIQSFVFGTPEIRRWVSDGQPTPTYTLDPGFQVTAVGEGIAVDPTTHELLVADAGAESIRRYDTTGALVATIATPGLAPQRIAAAPDGSIYVAQEASGDVTHLSGTGTVLDVLEGVGAVSALAVDPSSGRLVASVEAKLRSYSSTGTFLSDSASQGEAGIAIDGTSGSLYGFAGSSVNVYSPGTLPGVGAPVVSEVEAHSAHVSVEVDPGAGPPEGSAVRFEYSEDGGENWSSISDIEVSAAGTYEADLTDLEANLSFQVRAKALNSLASETSVVVPFATLAIAPLVETGAASDRTESSAVLNGTVNPVGQLTTYHFEYGLDTAYGNRVPIATEAAAGNLRQPRAVARTVAALQPGATYHYRLVATNASGETAGADRTFTTVGPGEAPPARAYEQVTPVDQHGAPVNGTNHFWAAEDGPWFVTGAGAAEPDGMSSQIWQHFISRRGFAGWSDWTQIDPPRSNDKLTTESVVAAVSEDGNHALVISNRALAPGGMEGPGVGNLYVYDIDSGIYEFVANAPGPNGYTLMAGIQSAPKIFLWGTPDFSSIVFYCQPSLLAPAVTGEQIYRWSESAGLELESVMPDGEPPVGVASPESALAGSRRRVSDDGSVSYFSITLGPDFGVYRRAEGQTTAISVVEGDATHTPQFGEIQGVSRDGRYAVFTSYVPLTSGTPEDGSPQLYRYDALTEEVTYLSPVGAGTSAVHAISDDAQTAYFYDGSAHLAVARGDQVRIVGLDVGDNVGVASPSGQYYARVSSEGKVMLYDAETDSDACVSCLADGSAGAAAYLVNSGRKPGNRISRVVLDNGMVVFSTKNQLVTQDHNGSFDVYAYQHGRVTLISPGDGPYDALITEASADGGDIFFTTDEPLVDQDTNGVGDVYDARVGGGFPEPTPVRDCDGEACKGSPASAPPAPNVGSSAPGRNEGAQKGAIGKIKKLTSSDRSMLAKGGKAHLKVRVNGPGKVTVTGKASGAAKAKTAGTVSVPISLSRGALSELKSKGRLTVSLTVRFEDASPKVVSVTLRSTSSKKGGSR